MQIATSASTGIRMAVPQPLPDGAKPVPSAKDYPAAWVTDEPLVRIVLTNVRHNFFGSKTYETNDPGKPSPSYRLGAAFTPVVHDAIPKEALSFANRAQNAFAKLGKVSFADAVRAASREARYITNNSGKSAGTVGVLQAIDGAYYLAPITGYYRTFSLLDAPENTKKDTYSIDVQRVTPDLKALVGVSKWVNFTEEAIDFDPSVTA